jgi:hypothetical protein
MDAVTALLNASAKLRHAQNELEQVLQDYAIDSWHFEARMDEVRDVVDTWVRELDEGVDPANLTQEFVFDRQG